MCVEWVCCGVRGYDGVRGDVCDVERVSMLMYVYCVHMRHVCG